MAILDDVKAALRISASTTLFNTEVSDLIAAARDDLRLSGVLTTKVTNDADTLIRRAITVYCKANFGYDNADADRLQKSYDMIKAHLTLSQEYTAFDVTFTVKVGATPLPDAIVTFNGQTIITNSSGVALFTGLKESQNNEYTVTLDGYADVADEVDVNGTTSVNVAMVAS